MVKLLLAEKSDKEKDAQTDDLGENPLAKHSFHSPSNRARRREKMALMRGGHSR